MLDGPHRGQPLVVAVQAEAEALLARGTAEAKALQTQADAYQQFNQAAVLDRLMTVMPELAKALAEPLGRVDKITVVSTGDGGTNGSGVNRITNDVATMVAQTPAMLEALTGISIGDLLKTVPQIRNANVPASNGHEASEKMSSDAGSEPTV